MKSGVRGSVAGWSQIDAIIPFEREAAAALSNARNREAVGRSISRVLSAQAGRGGLAAAISALKSDVRQAGLTDAEIDTELTAHNSEHRE
jgi:hypothetical protein